MNDTTPPKRGKGAPPRNRERPDDERNGMIRWYGSKREKQSLRLALDFMRKHPQDWEALERTFMDK